MAHVKKKQTKTISSKKLTDSIEWVQIEAYRGVGNKLNEDKIAFALEKHKKHNEFADRVKVRIGLNILNKLNWNYGDKIVPMYNPDNVFQFLLCKSGHGTGYSVSKESGYTVGAVSFPWINPLKVDSKPSKIIDFIVVNQYLSFTIDP